MGGSKSAIFRQADVSQDCLICIIGLLAISVNVSTQPYTKDSRRSELLKISASIIQGSGLGPAAYVVTAVDLQALTPGNRLP